MSQVTVTTHPERIGRLVLTNCDSHENFPPGIFKAFPPLARIPGVLRAMGLPTRFAAVRRKAYGPFAKKPIPEELLVGWTEPGLHDAAIRRDTKAFTVEMNKRHTLAAAEKLPAFDRPTLLVWAPEDRFFPIRYAERLEQAIPDARLVDGARREDLRLARPTGRRRRCDRGVHGRDERNRVARLGGRRAAGQVRPSRGRPRPRPSPPP